MRFTSIAFSFTALLSAFAAAAPTANNDMAKRMPTPEEFAPLSDVEKRKVYTSWYRATNILPSTVSKHGIYNDIPVERDADNLKGRLSAVERRL